MQKNGYLYRSNFIKTLTPSWYITAQLLRSGINIYKVFQYSFRLNKIPSYRFFPGLCLLVNSKVFLFTINNYLLDPMWIGISAQSQKEKKKEEIGSNCQFWIKIRSWLLCSRNPDPHCLLQIIFTSSIFFTQCKHLHCRFIVHFQERCHFKESLKMHFRANWRCFLVFV